MALLFEWDPGKAKRNLEKHHVSFHEASTIFNDQFEITIDDPVHSRGERRYISIGRSLNQRLLIVAYTEREDRIRIISAWVATKEERRQYEENRD